MVLYQHSNGAYVGKMSLDAVMGWNTLFQIFCQNQEEKDLLDGYQLMYGRQVQVDIFDEWMKDYGPRKVFIGGNEFMSAGKSPLPLSFTTWQTDALRGL